MSYRRCLIATACVSMGGLDQPVKRRDIAAKHVHMDMDREDVYALICGLVASGVMRSTFEGVTLTKHGASKLFFSVSSMLKLAKLYGDLDNERDDDGTAFANAGFGERSRDDN